MMITFTRTPQPHNRLLPRMSRAGLIPPPVTNRHLHFIFFITLQLQTRGPLPISLLHALIHDIHLRLLIHTAQILHQLLRRRVDWHEKLDVCAGVVGPDRALPGLLLGFEDVDFGVFAWEGVVVPWGQADTASVVP